MDFVILGFLMMRDLSQYDLLKALERKVSPFYSASLGSIQAALKKLLKSGLITEQTDPDSTRNRKMYRLNSAGRQAFIAAMLEPINEKRFESQMSSKLFFLGLLPATDRKSVIKAAVDFLENQLKDFEGEMGAVKEYQVKPGFEDVAAFQIKTLALGIYEYRSLLKWFKDLLSELEA